MRAAAAVRTMSVVSAAVALVWLRGLQIPVVVAAADIQHINM
jgi:hypothetical protein